MNHLSHEELVDHVYGEDAPEAAGHLEACAACAEAHRALEADLAEIPSSAAPEPDAAYEERLWHALSPQLDPYPRKRRLWLRPAFWLGLSAAGACAALIVAAFFAGRVWEHRYQPHTMASAAPAPAQKKIVVVLLSDQLERSERLLLQLKHVSADDTEMLAPMRDEARSLLVTNRRCREEAEKTGDPDVTMALDHMDQLLTQLANQPGGLNAGSISKLQDEMKAEGLLFEVRVLRSRLPNRDHFKGGAA
jgi:anti-sigma-K factor RskA